MRRRDLLSGLPLLPFAGPLAAQTQDPGLRLVDVTSRAGIHFQHNSGAFGQKYLPETMGSGCAFIDYDNDGWQDIVLVNGMDFAGHPRKRTTLKLYRNNRNGTFTDVTAQAGLDVGMYGMGVAVGDFNNDGWPDLFITAVGQSRLFQNTGKGRFVDVTVKAGFGKHQSFASSAMWVDYDRDGRLDLLVCNYVRWSPETDVACSYDGKSKAYCTPEAYRGATCWLFRNRGDGTFEDVTAKARLFDNTSKSLGVAMIDYDADGWPDLFIANDTQPNKLYRNNRDGTFTEAAVKAGLAFSEDGKARAGMGVDVADFDRSGSEGIVVTNFQNEMLGLYRGTRGGTFIDTVPRGPLGAQTRKLLGFGCLFADLDLDGWLDLMVVNGHIDESVTRAKAGTEYAQSPLVLLNDRHGHFRDVTASLGEAFGRPKVGRGLAYGDFDNDGDVDVLITTNQGPAYLYRNDVSNGNRSVRVKLTGTQSNRDGIGALVRYWAGEAQGTRRVKSGSSYLSQSELPLTLGLGRAAAIDRLEVVWPNGRTEEYKGIKAGSRIEIIEAKGIR